MTEEETLELYSEIASGLSEVVFEADGPISLSVRLPDGTYKRRVIGPRQVFFLDSIYVGKVQKFILRLRPEDPSPEYEFVEVDSRSVDDAFPTMLEELNKWAVARYGDSFIESPDLKTFSEIVLVAEKTIRRRSAKDDLEELKSNPLFGMF